jgi:hypothetical protein
LIEGDQRLTGDIIPTSTAEGEGLDPGLEPNFGAVQLTEGVHTIEDLISGGDRDVSELNYGEGCVGYATRQPDYRVEFDAEDGKLEITFESEADTALVVNYMVAAGRPRWACNDNAGGGHNPLLVLERFTAGNPVPGRYAIWVAGVEDRHFDPGVLRVTATVAPPLPEEEEEPQAEPEAGVAGPSPQ